jgi:hypothetical protein
VASHTALSKAHVGDLAVIEWERRYLLHVRDRQPLAVREAEYLMAEVVSITRAGEVKEARDAAGVLRGRPTRTLTRSPGVRRVIVVSQDDVDVPAVLADARRRTFPGGTRPRALQSLRAVRAALHPHRIF